MSELRADMGGLCPGCEKKTRVERVKHRERIIVRGENVDVESEFGKCTECGEEFETTRGHDALDAAYREYRRRHGMLQPEEIRTWRKGMGLTQKELSALLGWGEATLSRYENGSLQEEAHDKVLRLAMEPHNLLRLLQEVPNAFGEEKRGRLLARISEAEAEECSLERVFEERFARHAPDEFNGFKKLELTKLFNVILFFCKGGQLKTKLNKLLFYADFKHFGEYAVSITGSRYVHLPHGPVPDNYEHYFATLIHRGELAVDEVEMYGYLGEVYTSVAEPALSTFSDSELKVLAEVKERFKKLNASECRELSHRERAYSETRDGDLISYRLADSLQI